MISDKDKLEALIGRALEQGFRWLEAFGHDGLIYYKGTVDEVAHQLIANKTAPLLLFNLDFNRALFGEEHSYKAATYIYSTRVPEYQWRMMRAVISDDKINYLYQAVFGEEK